MDMSMDQSKGGQIPTFRAEEVMVPGKMIIPFAMFFSSRMLSNLRDNKLRIGICGWENV
jgi:hypothetical protein